MTGAFEQTLVCGRCPSRPTMLIRFLAEPAYRCSGCGSARQHVSEDALLLDFTEQLQRLDTSALRAVFAELTTDEQDRMAWVFGELPTLLREGSGPWVHDVIQSLVDKCSWDGERLRVGWRAPFSWLRPSGVLHAPSPGEMKSELAQRTVEALLRVATAVETLAPAPAWLTRDQAAAHLQVSVDTLARVVKNADTMDGGPVDVGEGRRMLRFPSATLDAWFRRASKAPEVAAARKRRKSTKRTRAVERPGPTPVDWSKV